MYKKQRVILSRYVMFVIVFCYYGSNLVANKRKEVRQNLASFLLMCTPYIFTF
jgi:hypothetical protein